MLYHSSRKQIKTMRNCNTGGLLGNSIRRWGVRKGGRGGCQGCHSESGHTVLWSSEMLESRLGSGVRLSRHLKASTSSLTSRNGPSPGPKHLQPQAVVGMRIFHMDELSTKAGDARREERPPLARATSIKHVPIPASFFVYIWLSFCCSKILGERRATPLPALPKGKRSLEGL